ncbi:MAG: succinyldiaminopimelate transaminase [Gammaproteobacteria bacterium]|nr:succinyldiaminopimelate transaminase [Gammaproteobacteria bacterium]
MNPALARLHPYPFERLARLKAGVYPPEGLREIALSIGEPRHAPPPFIAEALVAALNTLGTYPAALGLPELRAACAGWLERRFRLAAGSVDPATMVLPVNGTREALFAFVQAAVDATKPAPAVLMPNPFYQIYEGAALLAGAEPVYLETSAANRWLPDLEAVPASTWDRCQVLFICTPGNPTGAVMDHAYLARVLELADRHGFIVASDECYSDIYLDEAAPPPGLLEACARLGRGFERCVVFHSLSKRSSVPGLRSGFVAGDPALLAQFRLYRTYHGCAVPVHTQLASIPAWQDDAHVVVNRALYREKFDAVLPILERCLEVGRPDASFYLWPRVPDADEPGSDEAFAKALYAYQAITTLPGSYLSRTVAGRNPGHGYLRISLVAPPAECVEAARRIHDFVTGR